MFTMWENEVEQQHKSKKHAKHALDVKNVIQQMDIAQCVNGMKESIQQHFSENLAQQMNGQIRMCEM